MINIMYFVEKLKAEALCRDLAQNGGASRQPAAKREAVPIIRAKIPDRSFTARTRAKSHVKKQKVSA